MPNIEWNLINDKTLLTHIINSTVLTKLTDINIKHVGIWRMGAVVASKYYKGNVVLVGDAAHSVPPAGGFGMNIGI
jgi:2-polyprenyl-6-methoxyphenol hydroxylase-like FAD-dependent oxidoreductase